MHIAIVSLGPSATTYYIAAESRGSMRDFCDRVYTINTNGSILNSDLTIHMDDVRIQEIRAKADPDGKIAHMLKWMKTHEGRVLTSRAHPDYPCLEDYPLEDVIKATGTPYFNNTGAYAIGHAIYEGATKISLFGFDFTYPDVAWAELGRGCCEFWCGVAAQRGIEIHIPGVSSLMDQNVPIQKRLYGYDTVKLNMQALEDGISIEKEFIPESEWPTAKEIEMSYDHSEYACRCEFDPPVKASEALQRLLDCDDVNTVLDVGSGTGDQANIMRSHGKSVTTISYIPPADMIGDFMDMEIHDTYDAVWASHVLEHQLDVGAFLRKCYGVLRDNGVLAITVPPMKSEIVGGHVTLWNTGLLIYNLIMAGFDCSKARVSGLYSSQRGDIPYNLSVIVRKKEAILPDNLERDFGDIEKLRRFFPLPVTHGFDGNLPSINWQRTKDV